MKDKDSKEQKVISLTERLQDKLLGADEELFANIADNFEDYLDFWLDQSFEQPDKFPLSMAWATYSDTPSKDFIPTQGIVILSNEERIVCLYSDEFHDNVMSLLGADEGGEDE